MNETKCTPGPWIAVDVKTAESLPHRWIANCGADQAVIIRESKRIANRNEAEANARLISKAPEMFEALKVCKACIASITFPSGDPACVAQSLEKINTLLGEIENGGGK